MLPSPVAIATLITAMLAGQSAAEIAETLRQPKEAIDRLLADDGIQTACRQLERQIHRRLQQGAFGTLAIAKDEGPAAMRRIVQIARDSLDDKTRLQANKDLLAYQGIIPAKRVEVIGADRIIDQMTPEELILFARDGVLPERFAVTRQAGRIAYQPHQRATQPAAIELAIEEEPPAAVVDEREDPLPARDPSDPTGSSPT